MESPSQENYYDVLEVMPGSSKEQIQQAYQRAKNAFGQDSLAMYSVMSEAETKEMLETIDEAHSILIDPVKRNQYDEARGIAPEVKKNLSREAMVKQRDQQIPQAKKVYMDRLTVQQKFELNYDVDHDMEQKIEETDNFSGSFLKEIREYKKVDIKRLSELTRISKTYLKNIEEEAFDKLPAAVYVRGFVFQYAKFLRINPELASKSYMTKFKESRA